MLTSASTAHSRLFGSLPERVQAAIADYANTAEVSIDVVILVAIAHFLELEFVPSADPQHDAEASSILNELPSRLQSEIENYAAEDGMPPEFVVELAIAHFLDPDSVTFEDCLIGVQRSRVELLRQYKRDRQISAA